MTNYIIGTKYKILFNMLLISFHTLHCTLDPHDTFDIIIDSLFLFKMIFFISLVDYKHELKSKWSLVLSFYLVRLNIV